jgi:hypothetical protein
VPALTPQQRGALGGRASADALTFAQRRQRARLAALERWSREDPTATAERGQQGLLDKFRREILEEFPDLVDPELSRRVEARRKAHMTRLSFMASRARSLNDAAG